MAERKSVCGQDSERMNDQNQSHCLAVLTPPQQQPLTKTANNHQPLHIEGRHCQAQINTQPTNVQETTPAKEAASVKKRKERLHIRNNIQPFFQPPLAPPNKPPRTPRHLSHYRQVISLKTTFKSSLGRRNNNNNPPTPRPKKKRGPNNPASSWPSRHSARDAASYRTPAAPWSATHRPAKRHTRAVCACAAPGGPCGWLFGIAPSYTREKRQSVSIAGIVQVGKKGGARKTYLGR